MTLHFNFLSNLTEAAFYKLVQASLKKETAVLGIFFNITLNIPKLPNTNILLLISLFCTAE